MAATKRMFSKDIVDSDKFYGLPIESQLLYFHLGLHADVKGFIEPKKIIRLVGLKIESLKPLLEVGMVIPFDSGVVVITDWNIHNKTRETHEAPTQFTKELSMIFLADTGKYELQESYSSTTVELPQRLDKIRLDKISMEEPIKGSSIGLFIEKFNQLFDKKYEVTKDRTNKLNKRLERFPLEKILTSLDNLASSEFHRGKNDRNWVADPDFLLRNDEQIDKFLNFDAKKKLSSSNLPL